MAGFQFFENLVWELRKFVADCFQAVFASDEVSLAACIRRGFADVMMISMTIGACPSHVTRTYDLTKHAAVTLEWTWWWCHLKRWSTQGVEVIAGNWQQFQSSSRWLNWRALIDHVWRKRKASVIHLVRLYRESSLRTPGFCISCRVWLRRKGSRTLSLRTPAQSSKGISCWLSWRVLLQMSKDRTLHLSNHVLLCRCGRSLSPGGGALLRRQPPLRNDQPLPPLRRRLGHSASAALPDGLHQRRTRWQQPDAGRIVQHPPSAPSCWHDGEQADAKMTQFPSFQFCFFRGFRKMFLVCFVTMFVYNRKMRGGQTCKISLFEVIRSKWS